MKLFLASEAKDPIPFQKLEEYIGGFANKTIAYIPTAANGEAWGSWKDSSTLQLLQSKGANVSIVQLEDYMYKDVIADLRGKDVIWFAGGSAGYLMYWVRRTYIDIHIKELLEKSMYVGSSAGAMIAGLSLDIAEWYPGEQEAGASFIPTLELVDFDIYPHYSEEMLSTIQENYHGTNMYLLKNGEAIMVENGKITVIGEERKV